MVTIIHVTVDVKLTNAPNKVGEISLKLQMGISPLSLAKILPPGAIDVIEDDRLGRNWNYPGEIVDCPNKAIIHVCLSVG